MMNKISLGLIALLTLGAGACVTAGFTYAAIYTPAKETYSFDGTGTGDDFSTFSIGHYFHGGDGTNTYPFLISNPTELRNLSKLYSHKLVTTAYYYKIANDFSWSGAALAPIGTAANPFNGNFDGDHQSIHALKVSSSAAYVGMFGEIKGATISNITLSAPQIACTSGAATYAGFICGRSVTTASAISGCRIYGGTSSLAVRAKMTSNAAATVVNIVSATGYTTGVTTSALLTVSTSGFIGTIDSTTTSVTPKTGNPSNFNNTTKSFYLGDSGIEIS